MNRKLVYDPQVMRDTREAIRGLVALINRMHAVAISSWPDMSPSNQSEYRENVQAILGELDALEKGVYAFGIAN